MEDRMSRRGRFHMVTMANTSASAISSVSSKVTGPSKPEDGHYSDVIDSQADIDPRVQIELETLNQSATDINRLEKEIDEARSKYQSTFSECSQQLEILRKKFGGSIKRARPYYELKEAAKEAQSEALRSARKFQSSNGVYLAAKETISLAELRLMDDKAASLSSAWQEMLNHALLRVTEAEREKSVSENEHLKRAAVFADMEKKLHLLEKKHKRSIAKARSYFETKKELELKLKQLKQAVEDLQQAMRSSKRRYSFALKHLEEISDGIHEKRRQELILMFPREPGVGAEENALQSECVHHLPSLSTCDVDSSVGSVDGHDDDDDDDDVYYDDSDEDNNGYSDINNESIFRAKVLTTSLDDEDTSFMHSKSGRRRRGKKPLKRTQSLPVYARHTPNCDSSCSPQQGSMGSQMSLEDEFQKPLVPLSDRADASPPDGDSLSSEKNIACDMDSSESTHGDSKDIMVESDKLEVSDTTGSSHHNEQNVLTKDRFCNSETTQHESDTNNEIKPQESDVTNGDPTDGQAQSTESIIHSNYLTSDAKVVTESDRPCIREGEDNNLIQIQNTNTDCPADPANLVDESEQKSTPEGESCHTADTVVKPTAKPRTIVISPSQSAESTENIPESFAS